MRGQTHPDTDVLADFRAGLLTRRRAALVTAHLADCARCTAVTEELAGVSALLAAVPAPPMPDRVAHQLDAVLAAEVAQRNHSERARGAPQREPANPVNPATRPRRPGHGGGFRWLSPRALAPAAMVAVLVAASGYFLSSRGSSPPPQGAAAAAPAGNPRASNSAPGALAKPASGTGPRNAAMSPAVFTVVLSPVNFRAATLPQQLAADLRVPVAARTTLSASATVTGCVHRVAGGAAVVRVESAHYEGQPVTVIVTRASQGEDVQLAGPGCSAASSHVLASTTVPTGISGP